MNDFSLKVLNFYLTWDCNYKCVHCWVEGGENNGISLSKDNALSILEKAKPLGLQGVKITGGEPLLCQDVITCVVGWCSKNGNISLGIETNGSLLSEAFIENNLLSKNVSLSISLNDFESEGHDKFVGFVGAFDKTIENIRLLNKYNLDFRVVVSMCEENVKHLEKIVELCKSFGAVGIKLNPIVPLGRGYSKIFNDGLDVHEIVKRISNKVDNYSLKYDIPIFLHVPLAFRSFHSLNDNGMLVCSHLNMLSILPDNALTICGYGGVNPKTIWGYYSKDLDLRDFWFNNPYLLNIRAAQASDGVCLNCVHNKICHGDCKALSVDCYDRWDAPSPFCQREYELGNFPKTRMII